MKNYSCILTMLGMYLCSVPVAYGKGDLSLSFGMTTTKEGLATKALRPEAERPSDVYLLNGRSYWSDASENDSAKGDPSSFLLRMTNERGMTTQQTITGTVQDGSGVMPGVTVTIEGKNAVTLTDSEGKYTIDAETGDILVFSYVGYKEFTVAATVSSSVVDVIMTEDATALQEVVVNAGYYTVKDSERTGSIAKITAKEIEKQPITNVLGTLQGRMAGVSITQDSGKPGSGFEVQIRGINSLRTGGNAPLYIIDGVPYSSEAIGNGISNAIMVYNTSPLSNINPGDVESIEVLKDADATAIYGSRGANGVVLVTTKKGKKGKTRFNARFSQGAGTVGRFMKLMDTEQYLAMRAEAFANDGITEYPTSAYDINGIWDPNRYTDWQEELLGGTSKINTINVSLSGGSDQTTFLMSSNYGSETTVFPGDFAYKKANVHLSLNHESTDRRFKASFSGSYTRQDNDQPSTDLTSIARGLAPNAPALYDAKGNLNWADNTFDNPLRYMEGQSLTQTRDLVANTQFSYLMLPSLEAKVSLGYTDLNHHESSTFPSTMINPAFGQGSESSSIYYTNTTRQSWIAEPQLNWRKEWGSLKTDVLLGSTFQQQTSLMASMSGTGFSSNSLIYNPDAAATADVMGYDESVYKYQSVFARVNLNLKGRYILNLTGRRDGSSRFGPDSRFGLFGAVGAAWLFGNEAFLAESHIVSFGKLRASYGLTGSDQIGNYQFYDTYTPGNAFYQNVVGLQPTRLYNAAFGWETNRKLEVALETGFLKDRIFLTAAWYRNRSSDQLVGVPLPGTTGFPEIQSNLDATVENTGTELTLRTENLAGKDFGWTTTINLSVAKNKLVSFPNLEGSTFNTQYVVGSPLNIEKVYHYTGIDPETGLYTFEDLNGDGMISAPDDRQVVKDLNPQYFGGVLNQIRYKGLQLDFLFQFVKQDNYKIAGMTAVPGTMYNQSTVVLDHWQVAGDNGPTQRYTSGANSAAVDASYKYAASDAVIADASFVRLKNVSLSYDIPPRWLGNVQCQLQLTAQNLLTFTSFKGPDPEFRATGHLPPLRIITAGLQFNF